MTSQPATHLPPTLQEPPLQPHTTQLHPVQQTSLHPRIAYLVHDLNDAAVFRRVRSLMRGGAELAVAGFYRRERVTDIAGSRALALGQSRDARLLQRVRLVIGNLLAPQRLRRLTANAQVLVARNLEMLLLAAFVRHRGQRLVFECLDIHRIMLRSDMLGSLMRALERQLLNRCDLVLVSSPAFARSYFGKIQNYDGPMVLLENKVLDSACAPRALAAPIAPRPPWRIGWFGMIRCARSLAMLSEVVRQAGGQIEVVIAGIPSLGEFDDFHAQVADTPGISFAGAYVPEDLPEMYRTVHFSWCIDYFEEALNSQWLLPNRLYESIAHGAVPIALGEVETGRWLEDAGLGLVLDSGPRIGAALERLDPADYLVLRNAVAALPRRRVAFAQEDHVDLVRHLGTGL